MITKEQYEAAKKIVDEYEQAKYIQKMAEEDDDEDYFDEDEISEQDRQEEEDFERACACTCGAWVVGSNGKGIHVADCYCGAE